MQLSTFRQGRKPGRTYSIPRTANQKPQTEKNVSSPRYYESRKQLTTNSCIMSNLKNFIQSSTYQSFMKRLLMYSLIVLVIGVAFWLLRLPGANIMLIVSDGTLVIWLIFTLIEKLFFRD